MKNKTKQNQASLSLKRVKYTCGKSSLGGWRGFLLIALFFPLWGGGLWGGASCSANALSITNVGMGTVAGTLTFTITWQNSWNVTQTPLNHDAVWVFVKYAACVAGVPPVWQHGLLSTISTDHSTSNANLMVQAVSDGMGVFVRPALSYYTLPATMGPYNVTLKLNIAGAATYNFKVFGLEMVYTPGSDFQLGDGGSDKAFSSVLVNTTLETSGAANAFTAIGGTGTTTNAMPAAYPVGFNAFYCMKYEISQQEYVDFLNTLTYDQQVARTAYPPNSPAPVGTTDGYAMIATGVGPAYRNGIRLQAPGVANTQPAVYMNDLNGDRVGTLTSASTDGLNIACNYLSWADVASYLDWAALRPMSEMEYEKECRGTAARVLCEVPCGVTQTGGLYYYINNNLACPYWYRAWPTGNFSPKGNYGSPNPGCLTVGTEGMNTETATANLSGNAPMATMYYQGNGPLRVGFAATAATARVTSGAGFYGAMDLGGNVWERTVSTDANGILFDGSVLGDGTLAAGGDADAASWPPAAATGTGYRGGYWNSYEPAAAPTPVYSGAVGGAFTIGVTYGVCVQAGNTNGYYYTMYPRDVRTSSRFYATTVDATRTWGFGGRGVR